MSMPAHSHPHGTIGETSVGADDGTATVFISYSRKDLAFVDRLDRALRARGVEMLVDRDAIEIGERWFDRIQDLISRAETVLFVLSPASIDSKICADEVEFGRRLGKRFIPVVARRVDDPSVPAALGELNYVFLDDEATYENRIDQLVTAIRTDLAWMRAHADLGRSAQEWNQAGRPRGLLLRASRLRSAQDWIARRPTNAPLPTDDTQNLIAASARAARRLRSGLIGALVVGLGLALGLAGLAYWQRQEAITQQVAAARERDRATQALANAKDAAEGLIFDIGQRLRGRGLPIELVRDVFGQSETLMARLVDSAPDNLSILRTQAVMFSEFAETYATGGDTEKQKNAAERALGLFRRLAEAEPLEPGVHRDLAIGLNGLGDAQTARGDISGALRNYEAGLAITRRLAAAEPADARAQRNLAVSLDRMGNIQMTRGDLAASFESYEAGLAIYRRLAEADPNDQAAQVSLSISLLKKGDVESAGGNLARATTIYEAGLVVLRRATEADPADLGAWRQLLATLDRVGGVQAARGDLVAALGSYEASLAIARRLAEADPSNAWAQAALAAGLDRVGDIQAARGALSDAMRGYEAGLVIRRQLVAADPSNSITQRGFVLGLENVASIQTRRGDLAAAREGYEAGLAISRRLSEADPSSASARSNLAASLLRVGDNRLAHADIDGASESYEANLSIRRRLAEDDPTNANAQRGLSVALVKVGDVRRVRGDLDAAFASYEASLAITRRLAEADSSNASLQRELSVGLARVGDIQAARGEENAALTAYETSLAINRRLLEIDPSNARAQRDVAVGLAKIGLVKEMLREPVAAYRRYEASLAIRRRLAEADISNADAHADLADVLRAMARLFSGIGPNDASCTFMIEGRDLLVSVRARASESVLLDQEIKWFRDWMAKLDCDEARSRATQLGRAAYRALLARDFGSALKSSDEALALAPQQVWLQTNRAHALMLLERVEEARKVYLEHRAQMTLQGKTWEKAITDDFAELRKVGITHPLMSEIEGAFSKP